MVRVLFMRSRLHQHIGVGAALTAFGMVGFAAMGPSSRRALTSAGAGIYNNLAAAPVRSIGKAGLLGMEVSAREMWREQGAIVISVRRAG